MLSSEMYSTSTNGLNINSSNVGSLETKLTDLPVSIHLHNSNTQRVINTNKIIRNIIIDFKL